MVSLQHKKVIKNKNKLKKSENKKKVIWASPGTWEMASGAPAFLMDSGACGLMS